MEECQNEEVLTPLGTDDINEKTVTDEAIDEPKKGMVFGSAEEVHEFYRDYARQLGFTIIKRSSKLDDDGNLKYVIYSCSCEGKRRSKSDNNVRPLPTSKTKCGARINALLGPDGKWKLCTVELQHNHVLSPWNARSCSCHRSLDGKEKRRLELLTPEAQRRDMLNEAFEEIAILGAESDEKCNMVLDCLRELKEKLSYFGPKSVGSSHTHVGSDPTLGHSAHVGVEQRDNIKCLSPLPVNSKVRQLEKRKETKLKPKGKKQEVEGNQQTNGLNGFNGAQPPPSSVIGTQERMNFGSMGRYPIPAGVPVVIYYGIQLPQP